MNWRTTEPVQGRNLMFFTRRGFVGVLTALIFLTAAVGQAAQAETKRIMLYGDSNTWGWIPVKEGFPSTRYDEATRWPGIFRAGLGQDFEVIDEVGEHGVGGGRT